MTERSKSISRLFFVYVIVAVHIIVLFFDAAKIQQILVTTYIFTSFFTIKVTNDIGLTCFLPFLNN